MPLSERDPLVGGGGGGVACGDDPDAAPILWAGVVCAPCSGFLCWALVAVVTFLVSLPICEARTGHRCTPEDSPARFLGAQWAIVVSAGATLCALGGALGACATRRRAMAALGMLMVAACGTLLALSVRWQARR